MLKSVKNNNQTTMTTLLTSLN